MKKIQLCLVIVCFLGQFVSAEEEMDPCSVAFYPKTACITDGSRSLYLQFLNCTSPSAEVSRAYFRYYRLISRDGKVLHDNADSSLPITWKELVVPRKYFRLNGYVTVFYREDQANRKEKSMRIMIPSCN